MPNRWIEFVKDFSNRNNISYSKAVASPKCKEQYYKSLGKKTGAGCGKSKVQVHHHSHARQPNDTPANRRDSSSSSSSSQSSDIPTHNSEIFSIDVPSRSRSSSSGISSDIHSSVKSDISGKGRKTGAGTAISKVRRFFAPTAPVAVSQATEEEQPVRQFPVRTLTPEQQKIKTKINKINKEIKYVNYEISQREVDNLNEANEYLEGLKREKVKLSNKLYELLGV